MACTQRQHDPIADALYDKHRLMLLTRGTPVNSFEVGSVLVKLPQSDPFLVPAAELFADWAAPEAKQELFAPLKADTWSNSIKAEAAAELAGTLGGADPKEFQGEANAAFTNAQSESFKIALTNPRLRLMKLHEVHQALHDVVPTAAAVDYFERGAALHFITGALNVVGARLELELEQNSDLLASFKGFLQAAKLVGKRQSERNHVYVLEPAGNAPMVLAFQCVELMFDENHAYTGFAQPDRLIGHREIDELPLAEYGSVTDGDSRFISLST